MNNSALFGFYRGSRINSMRVPYSAHNNAARDDCGCKGSKNRKNDKECKAKKSCKVKKSNGCSNNPISIATLQALARRRAAEEDTLEDILATAIIAAIVLALITTGGELIAEEDTLADQIAEAFEGNAVGLAAIAGEIAALQNDPAALIERVEELTGIDLVDGAAPAP